MRRIQASHRKDERPRDERRDDSVNRCGHCHFGTIEQLRAQRNADRHDYDVDPDWDAPPTDGLVASKTASDTGAGSLGFAGTVSKASEQAAGLATLPSDDFGGGPSVPMLPHSWTQGERTDPR
jgi:PPE-repeat protein